MEALQQYVDSLFRKYKGSHQIEELKLEVLSNLEAKVADLTSQGVSLDEAIHRAKSNLTSIDHLIEDEHQVYRNQFLLEYIQIALLYSLIAWIVTLPFMFMGVDPLLNTALIIITIVLGISYLLMYMKRRSPMMQKLSIMNLRAAMKLRKIGWIIWTIYIMVTMAYTTAMHFGSNIWFGRAVRIDGPYQFAMNSIPYLIPLLSIAIPLLLHAAPQLILKYKADGGE